MTTSNDPSRRTLVKGAAWSVPVVAVGAAAPAMAASPVRGIDGWVEMQHSRPWWGCDTSLTMDGTGSYPNRGLWVTDTRTWDTITDAFIDFSVSASIGQLTWSKVGSGTTCWSTPVWDRTDSISGESVHVYRTAYTCSITAATPRTLLDNRNFHYRANFYSCATYRIWAYRHVIVNNEVLAFRRGPIQFPNSSSNQQAPQHDEAQATAAPDTAQQPSGTEVQELTLNV